MQRLATRMMGTMLLACCLLVMTLPSIAFAPISPSRATATTGPIMASFASSSTRLGMFGWINDIFGSDDDKKAKEKEEQEKAANANAKAIREKLEAELQAKREEEQAMATKKAEEEAAVLAKVKADADARLAQLEAEQKAKADADAAAAKKAAEEKAKAEVEAAKAEAEEKAEAEKAQAEAAAVAAKVISEAEQSQERQSEETPSAGGKEASGDSIDEYIQEAIRTNSRVKGVVQWYNGGGGFGFIKPYRTEEERESLVSALRGDRKQKKIDKKTTTYSTGIFVHHREIQSPDSTFFRKLYAVEDVEYAIGVDDQDRPVAKDVTGPSGGFVKAVLKQQADRVKEKQE